MRTTLLATAAAVALLGYLLAKGQSSFGHHGVVHAGLIMLMGVVTAVPLVLFAVSAQNIPEHSGRRGVPSPSRHGPGREKIKVGRMT